MITWAIRCSDIKHYPNPHILVFFSTLVNIVMSVHTQETTSKILQMIQRV